MTSTAYSDITPAPVVIRTLTYMQAITGIFSSAAPSANPAGTSSQNAKRT